MTTRYGPQQCLLIQQCDWPGEKPPTYFWGTGDELPEGVLYQPDVRAIQNTSCSSSGASTADCAHWRCPVKSCGRESIPSPLAWSKPSRKPWRISRCAGVLGLEQVWDLRVREVEDRLRALYDEADYPSWERVRGCFDVRWNYFTMNTPQVLQAISSKLFVREQAKATVQWNEMLDEIRDGLRLTFKELVDALVERLTPNPDGTRKKLARADRLLEFLDTFNKKDVADDEQLRVLVEEVRGLLNGQDISKLRKDQGLREVVQERMQSVKVVLDTLVQDAPARQIMLRD